MYGMRVYRGANDMTCAALLSLLLAYSAKDLSTLYDAQEGYKTRIAEMRDRITLGQRFIIGDIPEEYLMDVRHLVNQVPGVAAHSVLQDGVGQIWVVKFR